MDARFFHGPLSETIDGVTTAWVCISPSTNGRSITIAHELLDALRARVQSVPLITEDHRAGEDDDSTHIEIGNTEFDKGRLRIMLHLRFYEERDALRAMLKSAGFIEGLPPAH